MFKCCVCNKGSKKSRRERRNDELDALVDSNKIESVKNGLTVGQEMSNGDAKKIAEDSTPNSPVESSDNREKSDASTDPESSKRRDETVEGTKNFDDSENPVEKSPSVKSTSERSEKETPCTRTSEPAKENCPVVRPKIGCLYGPAYIERTIADGPEEDGDDSVFEADVGTNEPEINNGTPARGMGTLPRWLSQEDDPENPSEGCGGMQEPPATPVARDELALRRHRFFSDLLQAARISTEHRVRFDPLGPTVHSG